MKHLARIVTIAAVALSLTTPAYATFSIVARDPNTGELGLAIASKFLAVRTSGSEAAAGVGIVVLQAATPHALSRRALDLLRAGRSADEVLKEILKDQTAENHQLSIIDTRGNVATSTGAKTVDWKGHRIGKGYSVQGNMLVGPQVLDAMAKSFESATGTLAERLLTALEAGDHVGGDKRGRQSAYLLVVKGTPQTDHFRRSMHDLSVDDHVFPITELRRLLIVSTTRAFTWDSEDAYQEKNVKRALQLAEAAARLTSGVKERTWLAYLLYVTGDSDRALSEFRAARLIDRALFDKEWLSEDYETYVKDAALKAKIKAP